MSPRRERNEGWPLFFVAAAGVCAFLLIGGEEPAAPSRVGDEPMRAASAAEQAVEDGQRIGNDLRETDSKGFESVSRKSVIEEPAMSEVSAALVVDPEAAAWFDWEFEATPQTRAIARRGLGGADRAAGRRNAAPSRVGSRSAPRR